jgi:PAS domain S-box-containing protein
MPAGALADVVADEVIALLGADSSAVFSFDGDEIVMVGGRAAPGHRMFTHGARFPIEEGMVSHRIRSTGRPVYARDYSDRPGDAPRRVGALGYRTVVGAPVFLAGRLWGNVYAASQHEDRLPPGTEHTLEVFAELCAVAIASGANLAQLESQTAEQAALLSVSRSVLESPEEERVLETIAREAALLLGLESGAVVRFDRGPSERLAEWHADAESSGRVAQDDLAALVRQRQDVVRLGDPDSTAIDTEQRALGHALGWGAPIRIERRLWGAVLVGGAPGRPVAADAADRLGRFSELSGLAIARVEARARLVEQLVETEQFAALVELSDDFIAIADLDGRCLYVNRGGRRMLGIASLEEARSHAIPEFLTPEGVKASLEVEQPAVREHGSWQGESTLRHFETGESIPVSINSFLVTHPITGAPLVLATVQRDLRDRQRAEEELRARAEEVEKLAAARRFLLVEALGAEDRMRRQIADSLHDDVLQELYAARQDLLEAKSEEEALQRALVSVDAASRELRGAVRDLHPAVSWTRDLGARLRAILERGAERGGFEPRLEFEAQSTGEDDDLVLALVREFVQNVVKHADAAEVTVAVTERADGLTVEVHDDGRGMAPSRPLDALRAGHIGLASARERVDALGGKFEISSKPGAGTRVRAVLPRGRLGPAASPTPL